MFPLPVLLTCAVMLVGVLMSKKGTPMLRLGMPASTPVSPMKIRVSVGSVEKPTLAEM